MWPARASIFRHDGALKLRRFYLVGSGKTYGLMLHHFVADDDLAFHDHPWRWAFSIVLAGGYFEEHMERDGRRRKRWLGVGRINFVRPLRFHRVELRDGRTAWTLFVHGPKFRNWRFLDIATGDIRPLRANLIGHPSALHTSGWVSEGMAVA